MKLSRIPVILLGSLLLVGALAFNSSAASVGSLSVWLYTGDKDVTAKSGQRVSSVTLTTEGSPAVITGFVATVQGVSNIDNQYLHLSLQDAAGAEIWVDGITILVGVNATSGATGTVLTWPSLYSPLASSVKNWSAVVTSTEDITTVGASGPITQGSGTFVEMGTPPAAATATADITGVTLTVTDPPFRMIGYVYDGTRANQTCVSPTLQGTSSTGGSTWRFTIDYNKAPFNGRVPTTFVNSLQDTATATAPHTIAVIGTGLAGTPYNAITHNASITKSITLSGFKICASLAVTTDVPAAYEKSPSKIGSRWSSLRACKIVTVSGNNTNSDGFGWKATIDMTDAFALLRTTDSAAPRSVDSPNGTVETAFNGTTTSYVVSNTSTTTIKGAETIDVTLCANR
jgi:hypothetical protein